HADGRGTGRTRRLSLQEADAEPSIGGKGDFAPRTCGRGGCDRFTRHEVRGFRGYGGRGRKEGRQSVQSDLTSARTRPTVGKCSVQASTRHRVSKGSRNLSFGTGIRVARVSGQAVPSF